MVIVDTYIWHFQANQLLGSAMTYTLFEYVKENADELTSEQQEMTQVRESDSSPRLLLHILWRLALILVLHLYNNIIILFFYNANSRMADRCAVQEI